MTSKDLERVNRIAETIIPVIVANQKLVYDKDSLINASAMAYDTAYLMVQLGIKDRTVYVKYLRETSNGL